MRGEGGKEVRGEGGKEVRGGRGRERKREGEKGMSSRALASGQ